MEDKGTQLTTTITSTRTTTTATTLTATTITTTTTVLCADSRDDCDTLHKAGFCGTSPDYMKELCAKRCGFCVDNTCDASAAHSAAVRDTYTTTVNNLLDGSQFNYTIDGESLIVDAATGATFLGGSAAAFQWPLDSHPPAPSVADDAGWSVAFTVTQSSNTGGYIFAKTDATVLCSFSV